MGLVSTAEGQARKLKNKRPQKRGTVGVSTSVEATKFTDTFLAKFPIELRHKVLRQAIRAAGAPVRTRARQKLAAHRSRITGTRDKWSKATAQRREGLKDLYDSMYIKLVDYDNDSVVLGMVGPRWSSGRHGHLVEFGGNRVFWGKQTGFEAPNPFMRPAAEETKSEQRRAMIKKVRTQWQKV